jgi:hypothetical protein
MPTLTEKALPHLSGRASHFSSCAGFTFLFAISRPLLYKAPASPGGFTRQLQAFQVGARPEVAAIMR